MMERSSSMANFKLDFNPKQAKIGHSSIDKLPIRKCNSTKSISQASAISKQAESQQKATIQKQQYNIQMLKRINESLERQNSYLKKQLDFFTQACSSRRVSLSNIPNTVSKQQSGYKQKLANRIDKADKMQLKNDKNDTESTGLFNSKFSNSSKKNQYIEESISEIYSRFLHNGLIPKIQTVSSTINDFLSSIKQSYLKLRIVCDQINKKSQKLPKQSTNILNFLQNIVIYSKNIQIGITCLKQKTKKQTIKTKNKKQALQSSYLKQRFYQLLEQFNSHNDMLTIIQQISKMAAKNDKTMASLKQSLGFMKLIRKMSKIQ